MLICDAQQPLQSDQLDFTKEISHIVGATMSFGTSSEQGELPIACYHFQRRTSYVRNFSARNSGAGNGRANFDGRLGFFGSFCWRNPMPIKFLVLGGGGGFWACLEGGRGWKSQFDFYGRGDFSHICYVLFRSFEKGLADRGGCRK